MIKVSRLISICILLLISNLIMAQEAPTVEEQMAGLQAMCSQTATARGERHAAKPLYERLGGTEKIEKLVREIIRLHSVNEQIKHTLENVDQENLAKHLVDFISAGTGGTAEYTGRSMPASHAHLKLTDADFLAAGGDVIKAMQTLGHGQEEIDEFICILVSLKDQVVLK